MPSAIPGWEELTADEAFHYVVAAQKLLSHIRWPRGQARARQKIATALVRIVERLADLYGGRAREPLLDASLASCASVQRLLMAIVAPELDPLRSCFLSLAARLRRMREGDPPSVRTLH